MASTVHSELTSVELLNAGTLRGLSGNAAYTAGTGVWTGADNAAAIQAALDSYIIDKTAPCKLPIGRFRLSEGLHLNYGDTYRSGGLEGLGQVYHGDAAFVGSLMVAAFSNQPCISMQGGRAQFLRELSLQGINYKHVLDNALGNINPLLDDVVLANWKGASLSVNSDSRTAPYAGVSIDGRTGGTPSPAYPGTYGRNPSSVVKIHDVGITGFWVGVVVQPNSDPDADNNGDFVGLCDCFITYCAIAVSVGQTQARNTICTNVVINLCHTAFTNKLHGKQLGKFSEFFNCHVGATIKIFDFSTLSNAGPISFRSLYGEQIYMLGSVDDATSSEVKFLIEQCEVHFDSQVSSRGIPPWILEAGASGFPLEINGGEWSSFYSVAPVELDANNILVRGLLLIPAAAQRASLYQKFASNALAGGFTCLRLGFGSITSGIRPKFLAYNLDTGANISSFTVPERWPSKRDRCTPIWCETHVPFNEPKLEGYRLPERVAVIDLATGTTGQSLTDRTLVFSFAARTETQFMINGGLPGDIELFAASGGIAFIRSRTALEVTAELQNNFKDDGSGGYDPINAMTLTSGTLYLANSRFYSPSYAIYGTFTSGSAIITNVGRRDGNGTFIETDIAVDDYLYVDDVLSAYVTQANAKVTARANGSPGTITLTGNASTSSTGLVRLGAFVRTPPANA